MLQHFWVAGVDVCAIPSAHASSKSGGSVGIPASFNYSSWKFIQQGLGSLPLFAHVAPGQHVAPQGRGDYEPRALMLPALSGPYLFSLSSGKSFSPAPTWKPNLTRLQPSRASPLGLHGATRSLRVQLVGATRFEKSPPR